MKDRKDKDGDLEGLTEKNKRDIEKLRNKLNTLQPEISYFFEDMLVSAKRAFDNENDEVALADYFQKSHQLLTLLDRAGFTLDVGTVHNIYDILGDNTTALKSLSTTKDYYEKSTKLVYEAQASLSKASEAVDDAKDIDPRYGIINLSTSALSQIIKKNNNREVVTQVDLELGKKYKPDGNKISKVLREDQFTLSETRNSLRKIFINLKNKKNPDDHDKLRIKQINQAISTLENFANNQHNDVESAENLKKTISNLLSSVQATKRPSVLGIFMNTSPTVTALQGALDKINKIILPSLRNSEPFKNKINAVEKSRPEKENLETMERKKEEEKEEENTIDFEEPALSMNELRAKLRHQEVVSGGERWDIKNEHHTIESATESLSNPIFENKSDHDPIIIIDPNNIKSHEVDLASSEKHEKEKIEIQERREINRNLKEFYKNEKIKEERLNNGYDVLNDNQKKLIDELKEYEDKFISIQNKKENSKQSNHVEQRINQLETVIGAVKQAREMCTQNPSEMNSYLSTLHQGLKVMSDEIDKTRNNKWLSGRPSSSFLKTCDALTGMLDHKLKSMKHEPEMKLEANVRPIMRNR